MYLDPENPGLVHATADELYRNKTPYLNFWMWCIMHDCVMKDPFNPDRFVPTFNWIGIRISADYDTNIAIDEMLADFESKYCLTPFYEWD